MGADIRVILALIDFAVETQRIEAFATAMAVRFGAKLCFLHVEPPEPDFVGYRAGPPTVRDHLAGEWREEHARIQEIAERARAAGADVLALQIQGVKVEAIVGEAERLQADLVIAGRHRHGFLYRIAKGDTLRQLADRLPCAILLVTEDPPEAG